jgi:uncharacterized protein (TIGR03663 family)
MDMKAKLKDCWPEIAIVALAAAARLTLLGMKPPHFDEGVNGWFVDQLTLTGFYHYDPTNYHGPLHFYVLFLAQTLLGRHVWALRLPLALMSTVTVWLTTRFDRFMGRGAALWAAAAMAVSPGCVFYGRYAIHEYWLVFALMLAAWGLAGLWKEGKRKYLWAVWIGVTLAVLTKETYAIHFLAFLLTVPCMWVLGTMSPMAEKEGAAAQEWTWRDIAGGALMFVGCVVFFYSGAFMDVKGLAGLYQAFAAWAQTGKAGNGHEKAWYYWVQLFGRYEWPSAVGLLVAMMCVLPRSPRWVWGGVAAAIGAFYGWCLIHRKTHWCAVCLTWPYIVLYAAGLVAVICAMARPPRFIRALAIYGTGTLVAYSIINYKTPWCIISLTWPYLLLFGYGIDLAWRELDERIGWAAYGTAGIGVLMLGANAAEMVRLNFFQYTDAREPYVYVQTFPEIALLMKPLEKLVALNPANYQITGNILMESYHPLPWLLGDFPNVGYYDEQTNPPKLDADFLMVDEDRVDDVETKLHDSYFTWTFRLRDAEDPSKLYLNAKIFQGIFPGRQPDFVPSKNPPADGDDKPDATPAAGGEKGQ